MRYPASAASVRGFVIWIAVMLEVSCSGGRVQSSTVSSPPAKAPPAAAPAAAAPPPPAGAASKSPAPEPSPGAAPAQPDQSDSDEATKLSAKRWAYASFFNRLKRSIAREWDPQAVWKALGPSRQAAIGANALTTVVRIALRPDGQLDDVVIDTSSGVSELDNEALRAVRAAALFPHPPEGLAKDGLIRILFSFHFDVNHGPGVSAGIKP